MHWYAVRSVFLFGKKSKKNVVEERIVVIQAQDEEEAFTKAELEAEEYAKNDDGPSFEIHPTMELYIQDGEDLIDGYEVWSQLFETDMSLNNFYYHRYTIYDYAPKKQT